MLTCKCFLTVPAGSCCAGGAAASASAGASSAAAGTHPAAAHGASPLLGAGAPCSGERRLRQIQFKGKS